jgi:hypothetical protein
VCEILRRVPAKQLMSLYRVAAFGAGEVDAFLQQVAAARGKLKKGGVVDVQVRPVPVPVPVPVCVCVCVCVCACACVCVCVCLGGGCVRAVVWLCSGRR